MKYKKTFYVLCGCIFAFTVAIFIWILLNILKVISSTSALMLTACIALLGMLFLSFCCGCILKSFYDDFKARRVNRNAKWHK